MEYSTAKAYLCNQGGSASHFLSRLNCCILNLADKHGITLILAYIPTHLNVEVFYHGEGWLHSGTSFLTWLRLYFIFGAPGGRSLSILTYQSLSAVLHLGKSITSESLEVNAFSYLWTYQVSCVYPPASVPLVLSTFQMSVQPSYSSGSVLDGGFLASHSSQHVGRHSLSVSHPKRLCHGYSVGQMLKGLPSLHLTF